MEELKSTMDTEFWGLICKVNVMEFRTTHEENLRAFMSKVDWILDLPLQGVTSGKLTPKILSPEELSDYVKGHDQFLGTVYFENPQYLYQVFSTHT